MLRKTLYMNKFFNGFLFDGKYAISMKIKCQLKLTFYVVYVSKSFQLLNY